jgi:hypothetical protein
MPDKLGSDFRRNGFYINPIIFKVKAVYMNGCTQITPGQWVSLWCTKVQTELLIIPTQEKGKGALAVHD